MKPNRIHRMSKTNTRTITRTTRTKQDTQHTTEQNRPGHTHTTLILPLWIHQMGDNAYDMHDLLN